MSTIAVEWAPVDCDGYRFMVARDALTIDGLRRSPVTPVEFDAVCREHDIVPLVPKLSDARFMASDLALPSTGYIELPFAEGVKRHNAAVDAKSPDKCKIVGNPCKPWMWPLAAEVLYGWHVLTDAMTWHGVKLYASVSTARLKVIQPQSDWHAGPNKSIVDGHHEDYAMGALVAQSTCIRLRDDVTCKTEEIYALWQGAGVAPRPVIKLGSDGPMVAHARAVMGYAGDAFDHPFDTVIRTFQRERGLANDGIIGPRTWGAPLSQHPFKQAKWYAKGRTAGPPNLLVFHVSITRPRAGAARLLALDIANYGPEKQTSVHWSVDASESWQSVLESDYAFGAKAGGRAVHYEACTGLGVDWRSPALWRESYHDNMLDQMAQRMAYSAWLWNIERRWGDLEDVIAERPCIVGHATITRASEQAKARKIKRKPWFNGSVWLVGDHDDTLPNEHRPAFIERVNHYYDRIVV